MATIYEVAALAGVSPATVSRVFNGQRVSVEKVERVRGAAAELQFTPSRTARRLRRQHSEVIALVLPDIENPYFTEMARGVEDVAQEAGYSVLLCNTDERVEKEAVYLGIAVSEDVAGIIVAPAAGADDDPVLASVAASGRAIVTVDRGTAHDVDGITVANEEAGAAAAGALADAGYRRIACIAGPVDVETAQRREAGWRRVVLERGLDDAPDRYLRLAGFRVDGGRTAMAELLDLPEPPDAVVTTNNLLGVGALQVLAERQLSPPAIGVAVVGGLPFTTLAPTAVTTVRLPAREMGMTAARMLLERIGGDDSPARSVVLEHEVVPAVR